MQFASNMRDFLFDFYLTVHTRDFLYRFLFFFFVKNKRIRVTCAVDRTIIESICAEGQKAQNNL